MVLSGERELIIGGARPIRISTGHQILHHDGKCSRPHGHNYKITVTVTESLTEEDWKVFLNPRRGALADLLGPPLYV